MEIELITTDYTRDIYYNINTDLIHFMHVLLHYVYIVIGNDNMTVDLQRVIDLIVKRANTFCCRRFL